MVEEAKGVGGERMEKTKEKNEFWEWTKALVIAIGLAFLIRYFLFAPIVVDGSSMEPTLFEGDRMIVNKMGKLDRFDIIVFHASEEKDYIKRIIGLPGDRIEYKDDVLYINGEQYDEPYLDELKKQILDGQLTQDFIVEEIPEGQIFVMGDNRKASKDSRHIGTVKIDEVIGDTKLIYWPYKEIRIVK